MDDKWDHAGFDQEHGDKKGGHHRGGRNSQRMRNRGNNYRLKINDGDKEKTEEKNEREVKKEGDNVKSLDNEEVIEKTDVENKFGEYGKRF